MKIVNTKIDYKKHKASKYVCLFTANGVLNKAVELVMGAGNALDSKNAHPKSAKAYGQYLKDSFGKMEVYKYGLIADETYPWAFQSKLHFKDNSDLNVIKMAVDHLTAYATVDSDIEFHLPFPGISLGGLKEEDVLPLLKKLPDNVIIHKL